MHRRARDLKHHSDRVQRVVETMSAAQSAITASWRRSLLYHGLAPDQTRNARRLTGRELKLASEKLDLLLHVSTPLIETLFKTVGHSGCCVVLTDVNGVVLRRLANEGDLADFQTSGLDTGAVWSESEQGTNGIGTCAIEQRPVSIHKDQHFQSKIIQLTCHGAPIFDAKGELIAVLDISSAKRDIDEAFNSVLSTLIVDFAARIEAEHFRASFSDAQIVIANGYCATGTPLLAADRDDLIIGANRSARRLLNLEDETFVTPIPRADLMGLTPQGGGLAEAERTAIRQAIARAKGNVTQAAKDLEVSRATFYRLLKKHNLAE